MSFKVTDLMTKVGFGDGGDTCTTVTRPTGCIVNSFLARAERPAQELSLLKKQLRQMLTRA